VPVVFTWPASEATCTVSCCDGKSRPTRVTVSVTLATLKLPSSALKLDAQNTRVPASPSSRMVTFASTCSPMCSVSALMLVYSKSTMRTLNDSSGYSYKKSSSTSIVTFFSVVPSSNVTNVSTPTKSSPISAVPLYVLYRT